MEDDFFDENCGGNDLNRESEKGFRDGFLSGKEASVQDGFNHGFKTAASASYLLGQARGIVGALAVLPPATEGDIEKLVEEAMLKSLHEDLSKVSSQDAATLYFHDVFVPKKEDTTQCVTGNCQAVRGESSCCLGEMSESGYHTSCSTTDQDFPREQKLGPSLYSYVEDASKLVKGLGIKIAYFNEEKETALDTQHDV